MSNFLVVDEILGELWTIPFGSLVATLGEPIVLSHKTWTNRFINTSIDSNAFLTAEVANELSGSSRSFPTHVFASGVEGRVVYTRAASIKNNSRWNEYGNLFHWPVSFEGHFDLNAELEEFGLAVSPTFGLQNHQRPHPSSIKGSKVVVDFATELVPSQREFYLSACCAPYMFRDCSFSLEQYWRSTKRHKEHHPNRLALKHRMQREQELRTLNSVNTLLEKSADPDVGKLVARNAKLGMRVLNDLLKTTTTKEEEAVSTRRRNAGGFASFFGDNGLPLELQRRIVEMAVESTLAQCESLKAWKMFTSMRLTCKDVGSMASESSNSLIRSASADLCNFVCTGAVLHEARMCNFQHWTYRDFGCSPTCLIDLASTLALHSSSSSSRSSRSSVWKFYFKARLASGLASNVCRQRSKLVDENQRQHTSSSRLERLRSILSDNA